MSPLPRSMMTVCASLAVFLLWSEPGRAAQDSVAVESLPHFGATLESDEVELGRPFALVLMATHVEGTSVGWPQPLLLGPALEEKNREITRRKQGQDLVVTELRVTLLAFDTAIVEVPVIEMSYDDGTGTQLRKRSKAIPLRVTGTVNMERPSLRPVVAPVDVPIRDWRLVGIVGGGTALLLLIAAAWFARRRHLYSAARAVTTAGPRLAPAEEALGRLDALEASGALDADVLKDAYLGMSEILRAYLGRRYGFSALDLTSSEIRSRLASVDGSGEWLQSIDSWLTQCDMVKYANEPADADEARESLYAARILIDRTKALEHEQPREVARA